MYIKVFSKRNIRAMRIFYEEYDTYEKWQQLVAKLLWKDNLLLIEKIKDKEIRKKYMLKVYKIKGGENRWLTTKKVIIKQP